MIIGYARVSTTEQNLDLQRDALKRCEKIVADIRKFGPCDRRAQECCLGSFPTRS
jgi:predicted site-specific integrase-resolvase